MPQKYEEPKKPNVSQQEQVSPNVRELINSLDSTIQKLETIGSNRIEFYLLYDSLLNTIKRAESSLKEDTLTEDEIKIIETAIERGKFVEQRCNLITAELIPVQFFKAKEISEVKEPKESENKKNKIKPDVSKKSNATKYSIFQTISNFFRRFSKRKALPSKMTSVSLETDKPEKRTLQNPEEILESGIDEIEATINGKTIPERKTAKGRDEWLENSEVRTQETINAGDTTIEKPIVNGRPEQRDKRDSLLKG